jgi:hypothetical protein
MLRNIVSVLIALLVCISSASATVILPIEFRELVTSTPVIVHGVVVDVRSSWVDGRRAVETFVTLEVAEYLKGNLGQHVTFKVPGGQLGRYRTVFVGAPTFTAGDELVLFLNSSGPSFPFIVGLTQGVFRVVPDTASGRRVVIPPIVLANAGESGQPIVRGDPARRSLPLQDFRELVGQVLSDSLRRPERRLGERRGRER